MVMPQVELDDFPVEVDETQEDEAHITYDIATYPSDFTLGGIVEMWNSEEITIPEFQREFVWSIRQSSLLIESFLLGLPVPPVFFYIDDENKNLVIDGQQRILSVIFFFEGFFGSENQQGRRRVFRLEGLDERNPYYRKTFSELSASELRKLRNSVLRAMNIRQLSPSGENTSVYHIFERLNTGGTPLKSQEIRNVVFRGEIVQILRELNRDPNWRLLLGQPNCNKHQADVELVLRVLAFSSSSRRYEKPMKEFLNKAMKRHQSGTGAAIGRFQSVFPMVTKRVVASLGQKPFHIRGGRLNTSALDSILSTLVRSFDRFPDDLSTRWNTLLEEPRFEEFTTIGTTDPTTVKQRYKLIDEYILGR